MECAEILTKFSKIKIAINDGQKALHKPLLLLLVLARYFRGGARIIPFKEIEPELTSLLQKYGPASKSTYPQLPFWHLQNDGIWELVNNEKLLDRKANDEPTRKMLIDQNVMGGLTKEIYLAVSQDSVASS
jgi:putative restriction endonuclease